MKLFSIVPFEVRLIAIALLALGLWWGWDEFKDALVEGALQKQNAAIAQQAANDNAAAVKRLAAKNEHLQAVLRARDQRIAALEAENRKDDDETKRFKDSDAEAKRWAEERVPAPFADRHNRVR